jgi:hypothetical protein
METALVLGLWIVLLGVGPRFFLLGYLPGYLAGLGLCAAQGYWEHYLGEPTSHYGRLYNLLCFNDGYHAEHHAHPGMHWTQLPNLVKDGADTSRWPPLLRWLDSPPLETLERLVLQSPWMQRFVLARHRQAFEKLAANLPRLQSVTIVGGGLFPRTALILREMFPASRITIVDFNHRNLETARAFLGESVDYREQRYLPGESCGSDLLVVPLCFCGDRSALYSHPAASAVLVHDWIWRRRGVGTRVSALLLKRVNLVRR